MDARLLIAERDDELLYQYKNYFVSLCGFEVETASDGLDCLTMLRRVKPVILILDMDLLWGSGEGVLTAMREWPDVPRVPLVLITGQSSPGELSGRSCHPSSHCLQKPFPPSDLLDRICTGLSHNRWERISTEHCKEIGDVDDSEGADTSYFCLDHKKRAGRNCEPVVL